MGLGNTKGGEGVRGTGTRARCDERKEHGMKRDGREREDKRRRKRAEGGRIRARRGTKE